MLGISGFKTKKALKDAAKTESKRFRPIETSMFGSEYRGDGTYAVVGPDPYKRVWYANVTVKDDIIVGVK
jgi:hypothetical protein